MMLYLNKGTEGKRHGGPEVVTPGVWQLWRLGSKWASVPLFWWLHHAHNSVLTAFSPLRFSRHLEHKFRVRENWLHWLVLIQCERPFFIGCCFANVQNLINCGQGNRIRWHGAWQLMHNQQLGLLCPKESISIVRSWSFISWSVLFLSIAGFHPITVIFHIFIAGTTQGARLWVTKRGIE